MSVDYDDDPQRWVNRRVDYLTSNDVGLSGVVARAVAWAELGYSASGIAGRMDVADTTAKNYLDRASDQYPGILRRGVSDLGGDPERGFDGMKSPPSTECPVCLKETLCGTQEAGEVFRVGSWGATSKLNDADLVCSWCHAVRVGGLWERMETVSSRAHTLSQTGSKSKQEYKNLLTRGVQAKKGGSRRRSTQDRGDKRW